VQAFSSEESELPVVREDDFFEAFLDERRVRMLTWSFSAFFMWRNFFVSNVITSSQLSLKSIVEFSSRCCDESGEPWLFWPVGVVGTTLLGRL
jgi:hypothetical protein